MNKHDRRLRAALDAMDGVLRRMRISLDPHADRLESALGKAFGEATADDLDALDAFIQRYQQLIEHFTHRLYPSLYRVLTSGDRPPDLLDLIIYFEQHLSAASSREWLARIELRNRLVHEYPLEEDERQQSLRAALLLSDQIIKEYEAIRLQIKARGWLTEEGGARG